MMRFQIFTLAAAASISACPIYAGNWPSWRGPAGDGVSAEKNLPVSWSKTKNVVWKTKLIGAGVSSPIVWNDRIFLTASDGRKNDRLHVFCYRSKDGKQLWHTKLFGTAPTNLYPPGGMAVPTPVTDGKSLWVLFGTGDLACLDFDGQPKWIRSLAQEYGPFRNRWGMSSSPLLLGSRLIVQVDHWGQSYLLGVDSATGKNDWKTNRTTHVNWTSPLAFLVKNRTILITNGTGKVEAYDPGDGRPLWSLTGINDQCVPSPVRSGNLVIVGNYENSLAIRPDGAAGDITSTHVAWKNKRDKAYVPTPLCYQGLMYIAGNTGIATCLDVKTGKRIWKERLGGQFHSSPVAGDGKVYFVNKEGTVYVIRAGAKFQFLARNDMGELIVASPAISNGQIFLRGAKHLFCVGDRTSAL